MPVNKTGGGGAGYSFEATDIIKAKDILGDRICIRGNVPISILATGTPERCPGLLQEAHRYVGKNGGYILDSSAGLDDAKTEDVRACSISPVNTVYIKDAFKGLEGEGNE